MTSATLGLILAGLTVSVSCKNAVKQNSDLESVGVKGHGAKVSLYVANSANVKKFGCSNDADAADPAANCEQDSRVVQISEYREKAATLGLSEVETNTLLAAMKSKAIKDDDDIKSGSTIVSGTKVRKVLKALFPDIAPVPGDVIVDDPKNPLLQDLESIAVEPEQNYAEDMVGTISPALAKLAKTPLKYGAARSRKPRKFAGATVLAAMRRMRSYYYTQPFEAVHGGGEMVSDPNSKAITLKKFSTLEVDADRVDFKTPFEKFSLAWNPEGTGNHGGNLRSMPTFWSDLQAHFYVISPHRRHGCWTMMLYAMRFGTITYADGTAFDATKNRSEISAVCSGLKILSDASVAANKSLAAALAALPIQLSAYNLLWVDVKERRFVNVPDDVRLALDMTSIKPAADIKKLVAVKFADNLRAAKDASGNPKYVNVWDYIMLAQLYAFDFEQQNAVLNAYFGDAKRWAGKGEFNPLDKADCTKWRAPRPGDPARGMHCRADKKMATDILSAGR